MKQFIPPLLSVLLLGAAGQAAAEKADAFKPTKINCSECDADGLSGTIIAYDSRKELFSLRNTSTGEDRKGGGVGTIILQPRRAAPVQALAGGEAR